jgi:hypothetical protein
VGRVVTWAVAGFVAFVVLVAAATGGVVTAIFGTSGQEPYCAAVTVTTTDPASISRPEVL